MCQPTRQAKGLGFPILRAVALTSLATGMVLALATGPYAGQETGETALFRTLFDKLHRGDLVLADRYYGGWFLLALLQELGVEFVTRLHQYRAADFRKGKRLGQRDHLVAWVKPQKPTWLDQETYDRLPQQLEVRELEVRVNVPGFRTESLVVVTSLRDHQRFSRDEMATLYRRRWVVELELRDIKSTMDLDVLRRQTPAAVRQELWTGLLAYNLIRQSLLQSALAGECRPDQLSFAAALQMLATRGCSPQFSTTHPPHRESQSVIANTSMLCESSTAIATASPTARIEPNLGPSNAAPAPSHYSPNYATSRAPNSSPVRKRNRISSQTPVMPDRPSGCPERIPLRLRRRPMKSGSHRRHDLAEIPGREWLRLRTASPLRSRRWFRSS